MKKVLNHIKSFVALTMATITLVLMAGFQMYSHTCSSQNISNYSVLIPAEECDHAQEQVLHDCCKAAAKQACDSSTSKEKDCCSDQSTYIKLDYESINSFQKAEFTQVQILLFNVACIDMTDLTSSDDEYSHTVWHVAQAPPPLSAPEKLAFIQSYLN